MNSGQKQLIDMCRYLCVIVQQSVYWHWTCWQIGLLVVDFFDLAIETRTAKREDLLEPVTECFVEVTVQERIGDRRDHADEKAQWKIVG